MSELSEAKQRLVDVGSDDYFTRIDATENTDWYDVASILGTALKDAEDEIAKLNYIDLPNEKVSNVFEAYLAWKSRAQASEKQVAELREALFRHREDLHGFSRRPCSTCRHSAEALGIKHLVPDSCAIGWETDERELQALKETADETNKEPVN
jgi:hypothetical protein